MRIRSGVGRLVTTGLVLLFGATALALISVPGAFGKYVAAITNSTNTSATNPYFTCGAAVTGESQTKAYFAYAFGEASGTTANDATGNGNNGTYTSSGVTYGVANSTVCPRDKKTVITLDGANGYITGAVSSSANPNVFSLEVWFKTSTAQGKLIGYGSNQTGNSGNYDRHLYIDSNGKLEFGVYPGSVKTIATPSAVTDGAWHYAVATMSTAGMFLYLDGSQVASNTSVTTGENHNSAGYWRIGEDNLNGWTNTPSSYFFKGSLAWVAEYNYAMTATQVAQHYAAGR